MPTLKERIIKLLKKGDGLTDREITDILFGGGPQRLKKIKFEINYIPLKKVIFILPLLWLLCSLGYGG